MGLPVISRDNKIEASLKNKMVGSIELVVKEIFRNYFGVEVNSSGSSGEAGLSDNSGCLCQVQLQQEDINIFLCFNFDVELLYSLVEQAYSGDDIKDPESYQDAACEIANIICCKVKSILNDSGYRLNMDLPRAVVEHKKLINSHDDVNMHFSVEGNRGFFVNLYSFN